MNISEVPLYHAEGETPYSLLYVGITEVSSNQSTNTLFLQEMSANIISKIYRRVKDPCIPRSWVVNLVGITREGNLHYRFVDAIPAAGMYLSDFPTASGIYLHFAVFSILTFSI